MARRSPEDDLQELLDLFPIVESLEPRGDAPLYEEVGEDHYRLYVSVGKQGLAAPVAELRFNRDDLAQAVALDRRANGAKSRDDDPFMCEKTVLRTAWAMFELAYAEDLQELDDDQFLGSMASPDDGLLGTHWFEDRLLRWLEEKDASKLDALRDALSKRAGVKRGRKPHRPDQEALDRAGKLWPEVYEAVRAFFWHWRGVETWEYEAAVRQDLVEHFLPDATPEVKDDCVKRLFNRNVGPLDKAAKLVSAATGLKQREVRGLVAPTRARQDIPD